jgi:CRISPR-associated protein Csd1
LAKHEYFVGLLRQASAVIPPLAPVAETLLDPENLKQIRESLSNRDTPAKRTDSVTIALDGHEPTILIQSEAWQDWYDEFRASLAKEKSDRTMRSFASGQSVTPVKTHGKVGPLTGVGGLPFGDALTSFKQDAFRHYGLEKAENAAVSEEEDAAYCTALSDLIRRRSQLLAGARIAYWYAGPRGTDVGSEDDPVPLVTGWEEEVEPEAAGVPEPSLEREASLQRQQVAQATQRACRLLEAVQKGEQPDLVETRFCAFSLGANSGRVVVRDWMQGEFHDLTASVLRWLSDLQVTRLEGSTLVTPRLESLVTCVLRIRKREEEYQDWVKPVGKLREPLWRAAVGGRPSKKDPQKVEPPPIPDDAIRMLLPQWRASILNGEFNAAVAGKVTDQFREWQLARSRLYARAALLKIFLVHKEIPMEPYLNEDHESDAYHYGRLLAILADLQREALGDVGAGVIQRYYARASTAPADALGPLIRLSNAHLDKLQKGLAFYFQDEIADVFGRMRDPNPPKTLDPVGQSLFAMGFYQQIAHMRHEMRQRKAEKERKAKKQVADTQSETEGV